MGTAALLEMEAPSAPAIYGDTEVLAESNFLDAVALATDIQTLTGILHAHALQVEVLNRRILVLSLNPFNACSSAFLVESKLVNFRMNTIIYRLSLNINGVNGFCRNGDNIFFAFFCDFICPFYLSSTCQHR